MLLLLTGRLGHAQVVSTAGLQELPSPSISLRFLEEHTYLEVIADDEDTAANEEPHYHEIHDSQIQERSGYAPEFRDHAFHCLCPRIREFGDRMCCHN